MSRPTDHHVAAVERTPDRPREPLWGPTSTGTVLVEIGGDVGALVVYTDPGALGAEIDIIRGGENRPLTHAAVRERRLSTGTAYAAMYSQLEAGGYTLRWEGTERAVAVAGGRVTEVRW